MPCGAVQRVLALGGGGFSADDDPRLDDFLLTLAPSGRRPRVCFVPTASGDAAGYIERFQAAFPPSRADTAVLRLFQRDVGDLTRFLAGQDVVYVGGGSTANLLALWRLHGLDVALVEAYAAGAVMAGVSAGMNCWFEASVTDSFHVEDLAPLRDGLGLLPGSACPHYDEEPMRRPTYLRLVADGFPPGYAAGAGCALLFEDGRLADAVCTRPQAAAARVVRVGTEAVERPLEPRMLRESPTSAPRALRNG